jgi:uncharacterized coiled-coil protein SlyX
MNRADELLEELRTNPTPAVITEARTVIELYRNQIRYLLSELHRIGWTPYPEETE